LVFGWLRHRLQSGGHGIRRLCAVFHDLADIATGSATAPALYVISGTEIGPVAAFFLVDRVRDCSCRVDTATMNLAAE
jgi:hypothetical protein